MKKAKKTKNTRYKNRRYLSILNILLAHPQNIEINIIAIDKWLYSLNDKKKDKNKNDINIFLV
ncbi:hypothetical protein A1D29_02700 [Pasteurellaceae bacterium Orientalotternb1]|nr:hypothetical protein A1D29_02700 [Pasteurellaceae bacterium Orientalotternb1]